TAEYEPAASTEPVPDLLAAPVAMETTTADFEADVRVDTDGGNSEYRYDVHMHSYRADGSRLGAAPPVARAHGPSQSRQQMMRTRRRMLTIVASLVFITGAFGAGGFVKWWICVPPVGLLVLYVLLLREIAMADAELARKRAAWEARAARDVWRRAHQAWQAERTAATGPTAAGSMAAGSMAARSMAAGPAAAGPAAAGPPAARPAAARPTAKIIDISSRVGDQLYDQYADAAVRAVGD